MVGLIELMVTYESPDKASVKSANGSRALYMLMLRHLHVYLAKSREDGRLCDLQAKLAE